MRYMTDNKRKAKVILYFSSSKKKYNMYYFDIMFHIENRIKLLEKRGISRYCNLFLNYENYNNS